jgi:outer membrane immunogenic protein
MKFLQLCLISASLTVAPNAFAADLPSGKNGPEPVFSATPANIWSGFYIGAQLGSLGMADSPREYNQATGQYLSTVPRFSTGAFTGGVHLGYDWQWNNWVVGAVGDVNAAHLRASGLDASGARLTDEVGGQGSARLRGGYAFDRLLLFATVGANLAGVNHSYQTDGASDLKRWGVIAPTVGLGAEYAFTDHWRGSVEYRTSGLGGVNDANTALAGEKIDHRMGEGALQLGVSYRFGD